MIIKRYWTKWKPFSKRDCYGYFLFGFIPLYISKSDWY